MRLVTKRRTLYALGVLFSTVPVIAAVLSYFPLWRERGSEAVLSGFSLLLLALATVPLARVIKERLRSPSAHLMWFLIFIFFYFFSKIADELTVISFVGFIGNLIGALLFRLSRRKTEKEVRPREEI